jgi:hypothetical protein
MQGGQSLDTQCGMPADLWICHGGINMEYISGKLMLLMDRAARMWMLKDRQRRVVLKMLLPK